eukprot:scaffold6417_cov95-Isochrysis_galbana.AAC.2
MTTPSSPPETSCFMFGLKATEVTPSLCPRNERSRAGSMLTPSPPRYRPLFAARGGKKSARAKYEN